MHDYVVVGAGLTGCMWAWKLRKTGKNVLVLEKSSSPGGLCHSEVRDGIDVHLHGCHIFHTSDREVWDFVNSVTPFIPHHLAIKATVAGKIYTLPFGMTLFNELWGVTKPRDAKRIIESQCFKGSPANLAEKAQSMVGTEIYEKFIKGYTEKQWGHRCEELPANIITRLPLRWTWDTSYFNDPYVGVPIQGWNTFF